MSKFAPKNSLRGDKTLKWIHSEVDSKTTEEKTDFTLQDKLKWTYDLGATFDYQQKWIADTSTYKLCVKARQVGMTTAIAIDALIDAIFHNEFVILIVSPSQRQSDRLMWYINKAFLRLQKKLE